MLEPNKKLVMRLAFTLTELLVVIAIIAILLAMGAGATFKFIDQQRVNGTENALRTIDKVLREQWKLVVNDAKNKEDPSPAVFALANNNADRARVLWIKIRLAEAFPQSFAEIQTAMANGGIYGVDSMGRQWIPSAQRKNMAQYSAKLALMNAATHQAATESSACLLMALTVDRGGAVLDEGNMAGFIHDTDNDNIKELVDNWGNVIQFQRFPIGNTDLMSLNPRANSAQALFGDPLDASGTLQQQDSSAGNKWYLTASGTLFANLGGTNWHPFPAGNPQPYWVPFVVSAGRDQVFGTSDDILSYRLIVGVAGY